MRLISCLGLVLLAGCAPFEPGLPDAPAASQGAYPELAPLDHLLEEAASPNRITPGATGSLAARAAQLRARAARMRSSALGDAERARIRTGIPERP